MFGLWELANELSLEYTVWKRTKMMEDWRLIPGAHSQTPNSYFLSSLFLSRFLKQEILCIALDVLEFTLDTYRPGWPPVQKLACFCLPRQYAATTRLTLILSELWDYLNTHKLTDFSGLSGISFYTAFETMHSHEPRPLQKSRYWELWSQKPMRDAPWLFPFLVPCFSLVQSYLLSPSFVPYGAWRTIRAGHKVWYSTSKHQLGAASHMEWQTQACKYLPQSLTKQTEDRHSTMTQDVKTRLI